MKGRKVITFSGLLQYEMFPLMPIVQLALKFGEQEMRRPVEIEFAATFDRTSRSGVMYPLQMRPIVSSRECIDEDLTLANKEKLLAYSARSLGNGITNDVADVVYVRPGAFDFSRNAVIADEVRQINEVLMAEKTGYLLAGPGRWGSSDESLGIPVEWGDICGVQFIVELAIDGKPIQPSQGSHFFQNLTSFGVGYFTVNPFGRDGEEFFRMEILESLPALHETAYVRHVRFPKPFVVKMDGMKSVGLVEIVDNS